LQQVFVELASGFKLLDAVEMLFFNQHHVIELHLNFAVFLLHTFQIGCAPVNISRQTGKNVANVVQEDFLGFFGGRCLVSTINLAKIVVLLVEESTGLVNRVEEITVFTVLVRLVVHIVQKFDKTAVELRDFHVGRYCFDLALNDSNSLVLFG